MHKYSGLFQAAVLFCLAAFTQPCFAVETHIWEQSDQASFARGTEKNLSVRSDGRLTLAPAFKELDSTGVPYLWAITQDSKGTLYYGGGAPTGATTKVFMLPRNGKSKVLATLPGLEVHALAVDRQDRVYAAVLPDAKIYRIDSSGKPQLFFDAKCKYIWSMIFDHSGNLFVATGDNGLIYRVSPNGEGSVFFRTEEAHARSMLIDEAGNLIVGTEPSGLIFRITPQGQSFVLYQAAKREITALAEHNGLIYAAAVGNKITGLRVTGAPPVLPANKPPVQATGAAQQGSAPPTLAPPVGSMNVAVQGGSDLYCIQKDGSTQKLWSSSTDLVYSIAFSPDGKPLLATGNKGVIYRIDSEQLFTELLDTPPSQVTNLFTGEDGVLYAITGNVGNLYSIGPGLEHSGTLESEVFDTHDFAYWGKAHITSIANGGDVKMEARSGNLSRPQSNWSPWAPVVIDKMGGQIEAPPARFLQYRLTLTAPATSAARSPEVSSVDIAFLPKNLPPRIEQIDVAPFNYREAPTNSFLERSVMPSGSPTTLTLPPVGQQRGGVNAIHVPNAASTTLQYHKGYVTLRWSATDPNDDDLSFKVELRTRSGGLWHVLKDHLDDGHYAFDSAAFPDGEYVARITASDAPDNTPADALSSSLESSPFTIDNSPPEIVDVKSTVAGSRRTLSFTAVDALSWIDKAEYSINGGDWTLLNPVNRVSGSKRLEYRLDADTNAIVAVRIFDDDDNVIVKQF